MKTTDLAVTIGTLVGGPDNVNTVTHCATRLRFVVKDKDKVRRDDLSATKGVIQVVESGGQIQVVIGPDVADVYRELIKAPGWARLSGEGDSGAKEKQGFVDWLFALLAGTFQPLLMPLVGASMLKMFLNVGSQLEWYDPAAPSAAISVMTAASNAFFYFLPILIAATASRRLGATPYLGAAAAAALLEPSFTGLGQAGDVLSFLGAPMYMFNYTSSIFPAIFIAIALSYLEPLLRRIIPKNLQLLVVPTVSLAVLVPLAALVFGPFGVIVGQALTDGIWAANSFSPALMGALLSGTFIFFVMFGLHWALVPVILSNIEAFGGDPIIAVTGGYNFAVWGLALAVFLRAPRGSELRELAGAGALSGLLAGVSEPMLYGVILRYKRVLPLLIVAATVSGAIIGAFGAKAGGFALSSVFTIPLMTPTLGYVIGIGVAFAMMFVGILLFGYEKKAQVTVGADTPPVAVAAVVPVTPAAPITGTLTVGSPISGKVIPLSEVPDPVFAGGAVGAGVGILPTSGQVVAPCDGIVIVAPASGHAVGLRTTDGVELLIHVGIDTVNLAGRGFTTHVEVKQEVKAGDALIDVDLKTIEEAGYSLATPVLITNARKIGEVSAATDGSVAVGDPLLVIAPARQDTAAS
ncbi:glucose PTS transporter subunit IIA [Tessaracoccus caeni]|uniref:glucose PTS transporter subunit IIA n=1 Tax=Tessaracoccus caeni TaxID=3031239 RepID=UPI0023D9D2B0|nr:glucose PTS transporter subunit IIA [Tessaracoccus caeni]MDF1489678.1 glucose PTS transporter subunit IIA [Tessaracoccus caeni]